MRTKSSYRIEIFSLLDRNEIIAKIMNLDMITTIKSNNQKSYPRLFWLIVGTKY